MVKKSVNQSYLIHERSEQLLLQLNRFSAFCHLSELKLENFKTRKVLLEINVDAIAAVNNEGV